MVLLVSGASATKGPAQGGLVDGDGDGDGSDLHRAVPVILDRFDLDLSSSHGCGVAGLGCRALRGGRPLKYGL